ncbi:hypothetical protein C8Q74DRAFT_982190 [Fomes fomentarius]|nr:hypothetical protein C8Q74DRAFT_982190 [Fomes fomentarius]
MGGANSKFKNSYICHISVQDSTLVYSCECTSGPQCVIRQPPPPYQDGTTTFSKPVCTSFATKITVSDKQDGINEVKSILDIVRQAPCTTHLSITTTSSTSSSTLHTLSTGSSSSLPQTGTTRDQPIPPSSITITETRTEPSILVSQGVSPSPHSKPSSATPSKAQSPSPDTHQSPKVIGIALAISIFILFLSISCYFRIRRRRHRLPQETEVARCADIGEETPPPYTPLAAPITRERPVSDKSGGASKLPPYGYTAHEPQVTHESEAAHDRDDPSQSAPGASPSSSVIPLLK